ncbi:MAG: AraC family transcriptional regulator [Clostridia bacterium]|nr:AraC family transcriptional regulator [Clostridia bacterium]
MYYNKWHEKIVYNNRMAYTLPFQVFLAGIGYPWAEYRILHNINGTNSWDKYILEYVLEGRGYAETDDGRFAVQAGDLFFMNRDRRIIYGAVPEEPYKKMFVVFHGTLADSLAENYGLTDSVIIRHVDAESSFRQLLQLLERSTAETHEADMDEAALAVHRLLLPLRSPAIVREMEKPGSTADKIRGYIDANLLMRDLSLGDLSDYFLLSRSQIIRQFRQHFGTTPGQYILQKRIETACYLLDVTRMPVGEIAAKLYFTDGCYFSAVFRRHTGFSPAAWRKRL